jgi:hypothetical protein
MKIIHLFLYSGSPCYASPEMIAGKKYVGSLSDMWSLGVILFALLCGYLPFEDPNTAKLYEKIMNGDYDLPDWVSKEGKDLIQRLLTTDPRKRITATQVRKHPWYSRHSMPTDPNNYTNSEAEAISVDHSIVGEMLPLGYSSETIIDSVQTNKHDHYAATYYLLQLKRKLNPSSNQNNHNYVPNPPNKLQGTLKPHPPTAPRIHLISTDLSTPSTSSALPSQRPSPSDSASNLIISAPINRPQRPTAQQPQSARPTRSAGPIRANFTPNGTGNKFSASGASTTRPITSISRPIPVPGSATPRGPVNSGQNSSNQAGSSGNNGPSVQHAVVRPVIMSASRKNYRADWRTNMARPVTARNTPRASNFPAENPSNNPLNQAQKTPAGYFQYSTVLSGPAAPAPVPPNAPVLSENSANPPVFSTPGVAGKPSVPRQHRTTSRASRAQRKQQLLDEKIQTHVDRVLFGAENSESQGNPGGISTGNNERGSTGAANPISIYNRAGNYKPHSARAGSSALPPENGLIIVRAAANSGSNSARAVSTAQTTRPVLNLAISPAIQAFYGASSSVNRPKTAANNNFIVQPTAPMKPRVAAAAPQFSPRAAVSFRPSTAASSISPRRKQAFISGNEGAAHSNSSSLGGENGGGEVSSIGSTSADDSSGNGDKFRTHSHANELVEEEL